MRAISDHVLFEQRLLRDDALQAEAREIDGAVFAGSVDGLLRAFDAATGAILWQYDVARPITGVNGIAGHGGAIDNASIVAARGMVFVNSGYAIMGGERPGNLFLAFRKKRAVN